MGILRYNRTRKTLRLEKINLSTELAVNSGKFQTKRTLEEMIPRKYHHLLDVFEEEEKTELPLHRPRLDLNIELEEGQGLPRKKIYALSEEELKELHEYIEQNEARGWIREVQAEGGSPIMFVKKRD